MMAGRVVDRYEEYVKNHLLFLYDYRKECNHIENEIYHCLMNMQNTGNGKRIEAQQFAKFYNQKDPSEKKRFLNLLQNRVEHIKQDHREAFGY